MSSDFTHCQSAGLPALNEGIFDRHAQAIDVAIVALLFLALLLVSLLKQLTPLTVLFVTPLYALLRWERLYPVLKSCWPLLLLPALAMISTIWSDEPVRSARYGFLYLMTVLPALFVGAGCDRDAILKGMFIAFAVYILLSIPLGNWVPWGGGGRAFAGLMKSKNASGDASALCFIVSTAMVFWAVSYRRPAWLIAALVMIPLALFSLWASRATGALIASLVAMPCLLLWTASRTLDRSYRNLIFVVALIAIFASLATINIWMPPLFEFVLESSGKDAGLTGRDILWRKADQLISERPWLGGGYNAFWVHNNLDAEYLWREMGIRTRRGFNFHNTPRDILVALGFVGLALYTVVAGFAVVLLFLRTMARPFHISILFCALVVFESPRLFFELIGFSNMHFATLLVFIAMAYGLRPPVLPYESNAAVK